MPGQCDILVAGPAGNVLFPALLMKEDLKPSLTTTHAKASRRVIADPPGWEDTSWDENGDGSLVHSLTQFLSPL